MKKVKNLIILLAASIILIGAWTYYLFLRNRTGTIKSERELQSIATQESSDEVSSIESDLSVTNFDNLDKELTDIENELNSP